jgi:N-acyl-phosphatidylethanolamine-hydrolysing phospholipase D
MILARETRRASAGSRSQTPVQLQTKFAAARSRTGITRVSCYRNAQMLRLEDGRFRNLHPHPRHGWLDLLRWQFGLGPREQPLVDHSVLPAFQPDAVPADLERISRPSRKHIQVTWIGHATFLIQVAGINLLTDPVFGRFCAPYPFPRLRRRVPLPVRLESLLPIHGVLLSHNHYDHLEVRTARKLDREPTWFIPLGNGEWFRQRKLENTVEMDWWHEADLGPISIISVPAQHFSARTPFDRNLTLWAGYVLRTPHGMIYFAGDSGYAPVFADIGNHLGPMRLSLIPIGAYAPRWFMAPVHMNPEEAVRVHLDVRSEFSIGMHWGTFRLADEPLAEPPIALRHALARRHVSANVFRTMRIGETLVL